MWSKTDQHMPVPNDYISWLAQTSLLIQWFYYTTAAILMPSPYRSRAFASKLHTVTAAIVFSFSFVVVMMIWAQYIMDPGTQMSKEERRLFTITWSHIVFWPLFAMLVDIFMWQHQRPKPRGYKAEIVPALISICGIAFCYVIVVRYNLWTYPIFRKFYVGCRPIIPMLCCFPIFVAFRRVYPKLLKYRYMRFGSDGN
uniref:Integral membrane protein n=1 Tax=Globodera rostochiensis TaxID=31243 RepID=A0A914GVG1_GLORO